MSQIPIYYAPPYKGRPNGQRGGSRGDVSVLNILRKNLTNAGDLCHNIPHHNTKQRVTLEGKKMRKEENKMGLVAKSFAVGALVAAALGMHKDADAQQCPGTGCAAPTNSSAAQANAVGGSSKTSVWALPGGGVSAAGVPGSGDFYGALVNSCLRSFGIGGFSIGYSNANAGRGTPEVQQCIDNAIKQRNAGILMESSDPTKVYVGIKAAAEQDHVLSGALTDAQQRSAACVDGELNAVGVCRKNKAAAETAVVSAPVVAAAVPAQVCTPAEENKGEDMTRCLRYEHRKAVNSCGIEYNKRECAVWQKGTFTPAP